LQCLAHNQCVALGQVDRTSELAASWRPIEETQIDPYLPVASDRFWESKSSTSKPVR